ncbi:MAG: GNAT family N-acetyltransferase [Saccharospirillaceae bacterium]|nr:GNAT family N-acetyltransferase [Pseudomonadales bacterium]NRB78775.1 GNAT family N-acetyltransferase [Saccharospirillaceae bacterium]
MWATHKKERLSINLIKRTIMLILNFKLPTLIRLLKLQSIIHKQLPAKGEYFYLNMLAVLPDKRGQGVASELINPILEICQTNNVSTYLETSNINNIELYKKKGFSISKTINFNSVSFYFMKT